MAGASVDKSHSANYNSTVLVYDPYDKTYEILTFDGITNTDPFHISGVDYDASTQHMLFSANSGTPFVATGANMSGANYVIRWDTNAHSVAYQADLAPFAAALPTAADGSGLSAGGFQDFASDARGNAYVPTCFHVPAIARITPSGDVSPWYVGAPVPATTGADGTASYPYLFLGVVHDAAAAQLVVAASHLGVFQTFALGDGEGEGECEDATPAPVPANVTMRGRPADGSYPGLGCDGLLNPARYGGRVLLCSELPLQGITLWATTDGFASVDYLGLVPDNSTADIATWGSPTATVEIGRTLYISHEYFHDMNVWNAPGNRSTFPLVDITAEVDALVTAAGLEVSSE